MSDGKTVRLNARVEEYYGGLCMRYDVDQWKTRIIPDGLNVATGDEIEVTFRVIRKPMNAEEALAWQADKRADVVHSVEKNAWFAVGKDAETGYVSSPLAALNALRDKLEGR